MSFFTVDCPYCGTPRKVSQNTQYECKECDAVITVGNDGKIKHSKPGKK